MNITFPANRKLKRMFTNILSVFVILAIALPVTTVASAASSSPFIGHWQAIDVDGSDMGLTIAGRPNGPFQITWTDKYISYCNGEAGIVRGTGWFNEGDPNLLEADLKLECFTIEAAQEFHLTFRYHPSTNTLSSRYSSGQVTIWHRPGRPQAPPPPLNLRVNYGDDWVESFYEGGHMVWITVTENDGVTVKATAELFTEPKDFWGGETGFQTRPEDWVPAQPNIQPNDWVFAWLDNGASAQVQIGDISGKIDLAADSIQGTISAPWFSSEVNVECFPWGAPEPQPDMKFDTIQPNGEDPYACSWADEWDIKAGQTVGVGYFGPDGNWVANSFFEPATIVVNSNDDVLADDGFCTLREAIIAANTNAPSGKASGECPAGLEFATDTIILAPDTTYSLTIDSTNEDGALDGDLDIWDNSPATDLVIRVEGGGIATISQDAPVDDRVLQVMATVEIEGLNLTGGGNVDVGGGVQNSGGTLIMSDSSVSGNTANYGGGIFNDELGTLILAGSTVSGNTANVDGGGVWNFGTLTVDASRIGANSTTYNGGGLFNYQGTATIQNGSIIGGDPSAGEGNVANLGGGMTVWSGSVTIDSSTVSGNSVSWDGGGIRIMSDGTVTVNTSTISGNSADNDGGGLHNHGSLMVDASQISNNTAVNGGGGIGNDRGNLTLTNSTVSANSSGYGGGAANWPNSTLTIDASTFTGNVAGDGGGINNHGTVTVRNGSEITGNTANWIGGGISNQAGGMLQVEGASIISGNSSDAFAGGLYNDSASTLTVANSTITSNVSIFGGGGIVNDGTLTVDNSVLSANSSGQGGALYNTGTATIGNGTLVGGAVAEQANIADDGGGGLFNLGTLTVYDSFVTGNNGTTYGGGLFNWTGGMLIIDNTTVSNNSANQGGGLHNKDGSTAIIQNGSIFSGNYATWSSGGIDNWGTITITGSVLRENMSPGEGDAIANGGSLSTVSITASCIVGNGDTAVFNALPIPLITTGNWWGDASGPSHWSNPGGTGDSVSDFVDFSGWLTEAPTFCK